jgi:type IV secretion system protein VirD4
MSPLSARNATLGSAGGIGRRRPDPTPWGWEVPTAGLLAWLSVAAATLLAAQGAAAWLTGHGWLWPDSSHLFPAFGGLLTGHVGADVDALDGLPSAVLVVVVAVILELVLLGLSVWAARWFWTTAGPGRRLGMATRADAETALGAGRLRRVRKLIRPDLYGAPRARTRSRGHGRRPSTTPSQDQDATPSTSAGSVAGSITDSVDAGLAAARANRVRYHRPSSAQPTDASTDGPVPQAAICTDLGGPVCGPRSGHRFSPAQVGWRLGSGAVPRAGELWVPFDRTTGVYGPQGSGKTLDLLTPALLSAPGAALVTLTKAEDLLLTVDHRATGPDGKPGGRPVAVLDPFGLAPGLPELVWDPVEGCVDSMVAERRAKAFTAGTVRGAVAQGSGDSAARFYAAEGAKVLQAYFHAAALTGSSIEDVLEWVANARGATTPEEILRSHPHAAPFWHGLLHGALHGDDRTAGNTTTTVQQAIALFFQASLRARCTPGTGRPATDLADLIASGGTIYLLGRDDPYASASPLMTAIAEHVLDTALQVANVSPFGRLCPPFLACLDELPSTAPLPTLRTRMANERALGLSFIYAAQTWRQLVICYGEDEARALFGLTNIIAVFGGSKDGLFNRELSDLTGSSRVSRTTYNRGHGFSGSGGTSHASSDEPILRPEEIRTLPERHALIVAENAKPLIARLTRCVDGKPGQRLLDAQTAGKARVTAARGHQQPMFARTTAAVTTAQHLNLSPTRPVAEQRPHRVDDDHEAAPEQAGQQTARQTGERVGDSSW